MNHLIAILLTLTSIVYGTRFTIHHQISTWLDPEKHYIEASDKITISAIDSLKDLTFVLNADLVITTETSGVSVELLEENVEAEDIGMDQEQYETAQKIKKNKYGLKFSNEIMGDKEFTLKFSGEIYYPIEQISSEYERGFSQTPGIIEERGVYLAGSSYWIPWFHDQMITFELTVSLPKEWDSISQGKRIGHEIRENRRFTTWNSPEPMEEIFLIAAKFYEYNYVAGPVNVMAFLRTADENLANKYLETTAQYLEMYRKLIGPYPFNKFALVENFWETGYGMPSFTLLGEKIIRFPFILHSSYPHELLHNYWGNSVYVDFTSGNWCEGITAYMADHLIKEQRGQGAEYRLSALQKYTDYVNPENDFALNNFIARHNAASEAIGYGKCLMVWDMLREQVGDDAFIQSFQKFYHENKFRRASFSDICKAFESVTGSDFKSFFEQWIDRKGAPELNLSDVKVTKTGADYHLDFILTQIQPEKAFVLNIPVAVSLKDKNEILKIYMSQKKQSYSLLFSESPKLLRIDPQLNVFRKLDANEIPPSLSKIFGSEKILIILPSKSSEEKINSYRNLADIWSRDREKNIKITTDKELTQLPDNRAVWIFGLSNSLRTIIEEGTKDYNIEINHNSIRFNQTSLDKRENSFIISVRHPRNPNSVAVWLTIADSEAVPGLARKLPHYGKYSYLAFQGNEPTNIAKGQWQAVHSPLMAPISGPDSGLTDSLNLVLPKRKALATLPPLFNAERMLGYVNYLASEELAGRGPGSVGIEKASQYIAENFKRAGLQGGADDGSYFQVWDAIVDENGTKAPVKNVIGIIPGIDERLSGQSVVVCAHYDHLGLGWPDVYKGNKGKIHFGADDNASGVAVMMELANLLGPSLKPKRTVVFVAFTLEENGLLGSRYYIKHTQRFPAKKIIAAINLDTVGRLDTKKLLVLNSSSANEWKFIFMGASYVTGVESEMVTQDLDASDQVSFIEAGVPAVQLFSGAHQDYHRPSDTADIIDPAGMVKVATFAKEGIVYLADRDDPLTFMGQQSSMTQKTGQKDRRRVTTGSMPDFAFSGDGVRIADFSANSPAAQAGLKKGDVILQIGTYKVTNLREYSDALKSFNPGDQVELKYQREGEIYTTKIRLMAR